VGVNEERGRGRKRRTPRPRTDGGTPAARRREREPRLARSQPRGVVAVTSDLLGLSSAKRAAVLAMVVCAVALTVAVPLRNYVSQRQELAAVTEQQRTLAAEVDRLTAERARLSDPAEAAAQARTRLGYVEPGEVPYVVQLPGAGAPPPPPQVGSGLTWYQALWRDVSGEDR
jgi:cell division protein FtsB